MKTLPCWPRTTATKARNCANRVVGGVFSDTARHAKQNIIWVTVLFIALFSGSADSSGSPDQVRNQPLECETSNSEPSTPYALIAEELLRIGKVTPLKFLLEPMQARKPAGNAIAKHSRSGGSLIMARPWRIRLLGQ